MTKGKIVEMFMVGFDPPSIAEVVGWSEVQRFQRKAQRWVRIKPWRTTARLAVAALVLLWTTIAASTSTFSFE